MLEATCFTQRFSQVSVVHAPACSHTDSVSQDHIRHRGVAITNAVLALADLLYLQITALAFANIGYQFFLVGSRVAPNIISEY